MTYPSTARLQCSARLENKHQLLSDFPLLVERVGRQIQQGGITNIVYVFQRFFFFRDPRGFAVKFYTEEGNWDIVGNNTPIFFIRSRNIFRESTG